MPLLSAVIHFATSVFLPPFVSRLAFIYSCSFSVWLLGLLDLTNSKLARIRIFVKDSDKKVFCCPKKYFRSTKRKKWKQSFRVSVFDIPRRAWRFTDIFFTYSCNKSSTRLLDRFTQLKKKPSSGFNGAVR